MATSNSNAESLNVLLIDDDEMSLELLTYLLAEKGYAVTPSPSGDAALQQLEHHPCPQVILTDLQMPGISGNALALQLRTLCPGAVLIAMSGSQPAHDMIGAYDVFVLKPFTMEQFAAACSKTTSVAPPAISDQATSILDPVIYRKLNDSMRPELVEQLYAFCLSDARQRIESMRQFSASGDDDSWRKAAHAIKGSCGMVGASQLHALADTMELQGLAHANHVASLDEFLLECEQLQRILIQHQTRPEKRDILKVSGHITQ
jgi:CheY-like chemotaxis protein